MSKMQHELVNILNFELFYCYSVCFEFRKYRSAFLRF